MGKKLELNWVGKGDEEKVEPRILLYDKKNSYGDQDTENMLIHGDNLLALRALENKYAGKVKCVYIDPPYNTGAVFENYDDNLEHSIWLDLMYKRLKIIYNLLALDGFFCCQVDDAEGQYLKIVLDEIFGRSNYLTTIYVRVRYPDKTLKEDMDFHKEIEQVHIYRKSPEAKPILDFIDVGFDKFIYKVEELSKPSKSIELGGKKVDIFEKGQYRIKKEEPSKYGLKEIWATGTILDGNSSGRFFRDYLTGRYEEDGYNVMYKVYDIGDDMYDYRYFTGPKRVSATKGKYYQGVPVDKLKNHTNTKAMPIHGFYDFAGSFGNCRQEGGASFRGGKKPEALIKLLLNHFSSKGDIVLDSFLGSGTTAAVAHKMGRKYIGIEIGDQCYDLCKKRLDSVINGDQTGISKEVGWSWNGGGGYRFYQLAPSLMKKDMFGELIINKEYNDEMLASAVALNEGYNYAPSDTVFWKQAKGTEDSYLFTTTKHITEPYIDAIAETMKEGEFLTIACKSYDKTTSTKYKNISVQKISTILLEKCAFDVDNYNLNIVSPPVYDDEEDEETIEAIENEEK